MKAFLRCLMLIAALFVGWATNAQSLEFYTYSTGVDATKWITVTDSTNLLGTGNADARASSLQNIGFTFPFANSAFTQFSVNSDGNLRLGPTVTGTANYSTPFSTSNSNINNPKINFFGCDGYFLDTIHYVYAENTVDANNDSLLVVEFCLGTFTSATRDQKYKWQVHMYPNGNIEAVMASTAPNQAPAASNQKGICFDSGDGWIIASDNTATHYTTGSSITWASGSWPSPNTYYAFTRPVVTCPNPTAITLHSFTSTTANISFTPAGSETAWLGTITPGIMGYNEITLTDTNVNLMFLTPNTEYTVTLRSICGVGDTSYPTSMTFRTSCAPTAVPFTENFDNVTTSTTSATGVMPSCWIIGDKDVSMTASQAPQVYYSSATSYSTSGNYSLRLYYRGYVALPPFDAPVDSLMLKFQVRQTASNYWLEVGVMDNPYDARTFVPIDTIHTANTVNHEYHEVLFNNYTGSGQYIAFHNILVPASSTSYSYNYLDDIEVDRLPSCIPPQQVNVSNVSTTGATISWTGNAESFTVAYGSDTNNLTTVSTSTTSITFTSLTPATHYYVRVKSVCSASDESSYSSFEDFTTPCEALAVPYVIDFDNVTTSTVSTTGEMPSCWTIGPADVSMTAAQSPQVYYSSSNAHSGDYSFRMYYRGYVALPAFQVPVDSLMLKFWLKQTSASYQLEVGVMSDPTDATTFVPIDTIDNASTGYEYVEVMLNNYTGSGQYIALHNITTTTYNYSYNYIDDLQVSLIPTCFTPQGVAVSNVTNNSATVSWTGNASIYAVACGDDTVTVTGNTATLTGLSSSTTYSVSVKALCSPTDESDYSFPVSFTTLCDALPLPYTEDFDNLDGTLPSCWTKIGTGTVAKYSSTSYAHSGSYSLRFNGSLTNLIILPEMDAPTNTLTLSTWMRPESFTNASCGTFSVGYVTDATDASSFVALETYTYSDFSASENKVIDFASAPANSYMAMIHTPTSTSWYWFVDDIEVTVNTPECVATTWITGDSTGSSYYTPVNNYYNYTLTETIIEAAEIGGPMRIDTISLHYMYSSPMTNKTDVTIWLQPTTKSSFSSTSDIDLLDSSIAVQIFSDSMNFSYGWNDIVLPTPYVFDGTSNLMLIVDDNSYDYDGSSYKFSTTSCSDYKTIAWYSDSQNPDPVTGNNSLTGSAFSNSKARYMYRVRMALKGCDLTTCHKPNDLAVSGVTPYSAVLTWSNNNSSTTTYTVINMADSSVVSSGVSAGSFTLFGLTPEMGYAFGVYANCAADDSSIVATVTFATPATCVVPSSFACGNITSSSATLSWSDNTNTGATYTIFDMSDTSVLATGLTGNTYTVTGLTPNTDYTFGIVANCSATDASSVVTVSARTSCVPETLPFTEDFSANLSSNLCWRGATGTTAAQVFAGASLNLTTPNWTYASSTRDGLEAGHYYKNVYGSSVKSWIITPAIDLSTVTSAQLSFDVALTDYYNAALPDLNGDTNTSQAFMVIVSPDGGNTWSAANATVWQNGTGDYTYASLADTVYQNKVISLNQYVGDTIKIAFYCQSLWSGGDNDLHIDNIAVTGESQVEPECVATTWITGDSTGSSYNTPVNNFYNYTLTETIIEAAEIGGPMRIDTISFHYMYSSPMTDKTDVTIWLQPTTKSSFSSTSDIDLLDSSIAVQIFSGSMNFSYGWNDIALPTPYVFDGTSNLMLIVDDNSYDYNGNSYKFSTTSCSDYKTITWYSDGQNPDPVTGNNSLTGSAYSSSKSRYMYRVRMALKGCDLTTCHKPNDLAVSGVTPYGATLSWSNNNSSTTTYTVINMADSSVVSSGVSAGSFAITGLTPETSYAFGVYANCAADDSSIVATVTFATPATCVVPSSFACGNITSSSVTLSWADNTNTGATYTIFDMSDTSVVATGLTGNTYSVTGLTPNTDYTFGIVANCSATDASSIVTVSARTNCVPETLPFTEDFSANLSSNLCWRGATGTTAAQVFAGASLSLTTPNWTYASSTRDGLEAGHYYKNVYGSSIKSWIITPAIDLSTVTSAQLSFDVALTDYANAALPDLNGDTNTSQAFMVIVSPDGGNTWSAANATVWQNGTGDYTYASLADTVYQNKVISLNQYVGDTIKIAFYCQSLWSGGDNDLHIDNIAVTEGSQVDSSCHVTIYAEDAYGDGWNGGTITIMQGTDTVGVYSMAGQGVSSTRIYDTITYEVLTGVPITFEWAAGSWAEEVSFTIVDGSNSAVYYCADGSMLSDAVFFTLSDACPSCSGIQDLAVSDITSSSITLSWSSDNSSATYSVYNMSDTSVIASGLTTTTFTVTGLTAETNYQFGVAAACSATESSAISTVNAFTGYCSPNPTSVDGSGITSVSFGGMTNTTHPTSASYANFSTMSGSVPAGTTATVDITYATGYTYGTIIWVDWNSNLVFEGNEVVYAGVSASSNPTTLTATFDIPATQALGNYRMRIVGADSYFDSYTGSIAAAADANPCATYSWGVAEDYTLIVTTMPECLAVTGLTATATYNSVTLNWTDANNTGATYTVYDMSDTSVVATGITGTTYTVTGLTPNTSYTFGVTANCSATASSTMVTVAIHTPCVAVAIPFYESFDTNSATLGCWTAYSMNTANSVGLSIFNTNGIALRFSSYYSASDYNQYAFSPVFNYTGTDNTLNFSVQYATYGSSDHLYFGYITPTDTVWSTEYYTTSGQSDVQTYTASIPATATQIAFHYYGSYAYYAWVDSVSVTEAPAAITMTISSADTAMGTTNPVPGTYTYLVGDTVTVNAVPNTGYSFDYWVFSYGAITDTITLSTYTGVVPAFAAGANFSLVAHFTPAQFNVTMATSNATMGTTVPAPGTYSYTLGDTLTISAVPATNCHFVQWSDGDTNATRLVTVTEAVTYTAVFDYNPITVTLLNSDSTMGTITPAPGIYTFHVGDTAVAQATPATGYHFNQWMISMAGLTDSMPNNPVTMILPTYLAGASITMTATYAPNLYSIDVYANDNTLGTVTGTGQYAYNSYATITATPAEHCIFVQWNDGDTNAVRNVLVTGNASYTATFQAIPQHEVTLTVDPENSGSVTGAGLYYEGESVTITATPNEGYHFLGWGLEESTDFDYVIFSHDPIYTFTMGETNIHYYAVFEEDATPATVHIRYDSYVGTVFINDVETSDYEGHVGDTITLRAVANDGFRFVNWVGEGIENPTSATITYVITAAETEIEANFEQLEGIIDVDGSIITIYSANNNIIVRGAEQQTIRVFDVVGRLVAQRSNANDEETIAMTNTGVYLVKVGDAPARRVVVRR